MALQTNTSFLADDIISPLEDTAYINSFHNPCSSFVDNNKDVCQEVLGNKMAALELGGETNGKNHHDRHNSGGCGDGSDSGLDIATPLNVGLHRNNSTICLDLECSNHLNGNISCDSSMISYSSDMCEKKNYECVSENGSESSSVLGTSTVVKTTNLIKRKVALFEGPTPLQSPTTPPAGQLAQVRQRSALNRTSSVTRPSPPNLQTRERAKSREKLQQSSNTKIRSTSIQKPQKPDSLPSPLTPSSQRTLQRTPSLSRARTPGTPSDDGHSKWTHVKSKIVTVAPKRGSSVTPDLNFLKSQQHLNIYGTLPRRKKQKSVEDLSVNRSSRSNSITRESRMTSSVVLSNSSVRRSPALKMLPPSNLATMPRTKKTSFILPKTKIYHETSVQTLISNSDFGVNDESFTACLSQSVKVDAVEVTEKSTQSDIRDREMEVLRDEIRILKEKQVELNGKLKEKTQKINSMEQVITREREEKIAVQRELHQNSERVVGMLEMARGTPTEEENRFDSFQMLESQIQWSGNELVEKKSEIIKLRKLCRSLQIELERSLAAQERIMDEKSIVEKESHELQDFLQYEKSVMSEALKETEAELNEFQRRYGDKEEENKVLRDECRHLVRLNEQRRQENKMMQSEYLVLETRNKELLEQQNISIKGSSKALSGLHTRLDNLVDQLIASYNISEQDLEDVVFHNEAYTGNDSSPDFLESLSNLTNSVTVEYSAACSRNNKNQKENDGSLSPQRNQSFIAAVISAIKHATITNKKSNNSGKRNAKINVSTEPVNGNNRDDESDSTEMLDSETEPCLMMDNVLEDVAMPDSHSHNMVSSSHMMISQIEVPSDLLNSVTSVTSIITVPDDSLLNLSQAITNRQQIEFQIAAVSPKKFNQFSCQREESICDDKETNCHDSINEMPSIQQDFCSNQQQAVVDQIISVDNLVTKLLKVLRLIQMDNDNCIQHLILDKNNLQQNKEELLEKIKDLQNVNVKLQDDLMDATEELMLKGSDLNNSKTEIQRHRNEIDEFLKNRRFSRYLQENSLLENQRQYQTIDDALELLNGIQHFVSQNPELIKLQKNLEEANYQSASKLPLYSAYLATDGESNNHSTDDGNYHLITISPRVDDISNGNNSCISSINHNINN